MNDASNSLARQADGLARTAIEVSNLYGFLATIFRQEISAQFLTHLRSADVRATLEAGNIDLGERVFDGPASEVLEELAVEYAALFLGPGGHISPHESIYAQDVTGNLWGKETVAVKRYIEALGFEYDKDFSGIPDHISVELELMGELARRESMAWEAGNRDQAANCLQYQQEFMREHLSSWIYTFCDRVVAAARLSFYRETARLLAEFLGGEEEELEHRLAAASA